jgi:hypothetical protein
MGVGSTCSSPPPSGIEDGGTGTGSASGISFALGVVQLDVRINVAKSRSIAAMNENGKEGHCSREEAERRVVRQLGNELVNKVGSEIDRRYHEGALTLRVAVASRRPHAIYGRYERTCSMKQVGQGQLGVPKNWEMRVQLTYSEPAARLEVPHVVKPTQAKPRANIVVSRVPATSPTPEAAMNEFYQQTAQAAPGLKRMNQENFWFGDGGEGIALTVSFHATPLLRLVQKHVFRIDDDVLTQLVATVDETRISELDSTLGDIMKSFTP